MSKEEIICSFIIGIASGIVSSVLVTVFYRLKDREKDRQIYFAELRQCFSRISGATGTNVEALSNVLNSNELPKVHKWIHLKQEELKIVCELQEKIGDLQEEIVSYYLRENELMDFVVKEEKTMEEIEFMLKEEFLQKIIHAHALILAQSINVQSLGNKIIKDIIKNNEKQNK